MCQYTTKGGYYNITERVAEPKKKASVSVNKKVVKKKKAAKKVAVKPAKKAV